MTHLPPNVYLHLTDAKLLFSSIVKYERPWLGGQGIGVLDSNAAKTHASLVGGRRASGQNCSIMSEKSSVLSVDSIVALIQQGSVCVI